MRPPGYYGLDNGYLKPFRRYSQSKSDVAKNRRKFCMFWPPIFFRGATPKFLDVHYKIEPDSDHVAKFGGDRPRDLGDWALNKKTSRVKHKPVRNYRSGWHNNNDRLL